MNLIKGFNKQDVSFIKKLKDDRIDVQYYLKERELKDENQIKNFVLRCKKILKSINVSMIRQKIKEVMK